MCMVVSRTAVVRVASMNSGTAEPQVPCTRALSVIALRIAVA